ncbi:MAG TPA: hypothetical protein VGZ73_22725 [Bryobacteraceae bacterium]|nr:hypothetical protein [Bryobacteraceae bacterium]
MGVEFGDTGTLVHMTIAGGLSATDKCSDIAGMLKGTNGIFSAVATGNTLTINASEGIFITDDFTGEFNLLSASKFGPQLASLVEIPGPNQNAVPPAGTTFSTFAMSDGAFGFNFTAGAAADGIAPASTYLATINGQLASHGLFLNQPFFLNGNLVGKKTSPFDPTTVTIGWGDTTSQYLANFGLLVQDAPVPEPGTLILSCVGLLALTLPICRKFDRVRRRSCRGSARAHFHCGVG